jgi:DNA-binding transcriptional LysR family regulator
MDTRLLIRFIAVVETRSFSRAALELNISQPAISKSITALEERLGVELLDRMSRGLSPTAYGEKLFERAKLITAETARLESEIEAMRNLMVGKVSIGAPGFSTPVLSAAISRIARRDKHISIRCLTGPRDVLIRPLRLGELDFIIATHSDDEAEGITQEELYVDYYSFVVKPGHPLSSKAMVTMRDLVCYPWIVSNSSTERSLRRAVRAAGLGFHLSTIQSNASALVNALLLDGDYVAPVPRETVRRELEEGSLYQLTLDEELAALDFLHGQKIALLRREGISLSAAAAALMAEIKNGCIQINKTP